MPRQKTEKAVPAYELRESVRIGEAIAANNGGEATDKLTLAEALGKPPLSSTFARLLASSNIYGLTKMENGNVALTDMGRKVFEPASEEDRRQGMVEAAKTPVLLASLYQRFNGKQIPKVDFAKNILKREFGVEDDKTELLWKVFLDDARFLGVIHEIKGTTFLNMGRAGVASALGELPHSNGEAQTDAPLPEEEPSVDQPALNTQPSDATKPKGKLKVFITHGKNKRILEQIETIVKYGEMEPVVAIRQESTAIPVPDKIFTAMRECQAGIINVSCDMASSTTEATPAFKINENVLIEIGAAFVLYNKKVILVVDKRITPPSNLQGLYLCYYEGDSLDLNQARFQPPGEE